MRLDINIWIIGFQWGHFYFFVIEISFVLRGWGGVMSYTMEKMGWGEWRTDSRKRINVAMKMPVFSLEFCHCTLKSPEHPRYHLYTTLVFMPHPFFLSLRKGRLLILKEFLESFYSKLLVGGLRVCCLEEENDLLSLFIQLKEKFSRLNPSAMLFQWCHNVPHENDFVSSLSISSW